MYSSGTLRGPGLSSGWQCRRTQCPISAWQRPTSHSCKRELRGPTLASRCLHSASPLQRMPSLPVPLPTQRGRSVATRAAATSILPLGFDLLTFLGSTVVMVPLFKKLKISPVLGFLLSGVVLHQLGLIRDPKDMEALSELGVLFLLFEMGLELSLDRLKALAKFAFGLGTLQMVFCTAIFTAFALPAGQGLGTKVLESLAHAPHNLVSIRSVDEAVVIAAALSMSSSAFVLQLLTERGEMPTRVGSATLGILLLQDIAVVPFLVLLPLVVQLQSSAPGGAAEVAEMAAEMASNPASLVALLGPTALKTCAGLGLLLVGGRLLLRRVFEIVARSDNSETFVALCLLTVAGAALLTQQLGFSDTMGAFTAGVLLSESSYKTQVEADIRPFRGLLLGLFFVSTGGSINMDVLRANWEVILWILAGLITIKTSVVAALGPQFGLTRSESIRTGFMLSQGGEFAFVLLSLASSLHVLPDNLNQVLIIVVVMSMALTPGLAQVGSVVGDWVDNAMTPRDGKGTALSSADIEEDIRRMTDNSDDSPVVICGFGPQGQILAALLDQPLASLPDPNQRSYIAFDLDPVRVQAAREAGFNAVYGDGSRAAVLKAAGVVKPRAIAVCLSNNKVAAHRAVASLRSSFPSVPLFALGGDIKDAAELEEAGADRCVMSTTSAGVALGTEILTRLGASSSEASKVGRDMEEAVALKATALSEQVARYGAAALADENVLVVSPAANATRRRKAPMVTASVDGGEDFDEGSPAPPDSLPSMESAMPSYMVARAAAAAAGAVTTASGSDTDAAPVPTLAAEYVVLNGSNGSSNGSSNGRTNGNGRGNGNGLNGSVEEVGVLEDVAVALASRQDTEPSSPRAIRNPIAGTAVACLECGDDDTECREEDVAEIVVVDADKQLRVVEELKRQTPAAVRARSPVIMRANAE